VRSNNHMHQF